MFKNYLKTTFRQLWRAKSYASINIFGLAIGMTSFLVILLYLNHELSYDRWHQDLDQVYKVSLHGSEEVFQTTATPLAELLRDRVPAVEVATRISNSVNFPMPLSYTDKNIDQLGVVAADSLFFNVFPYEITAGDKESPLRKPNTIAISDVVAATLFDRENPIGQLIKIYNAKEYEVTAVFQHPDAATHLDVQVVFRDDIPLGVNNWNNYSFQTYIKTAAAMNANAIEHAVAKVYYNERLKLQYDGLDYEQYQLSSHKEGLFTEDVKDIHNFPKYGSSKLGTISIVLGLAALLLFAGAINFSNLSIASSLRRAKEIAVKKVVGASRTTLFWQFLGEIAIQCCLALLISALLLTVGLPYFLQEFGISLSLFHRVQSFTLLWQVLAVLSIIILLSGLYPALFLSKYNTAQVLKGNFSQGKKGVALRNGLIVVQFVVAAFFIVGVFVVHQQMQYMQDADRGFSGEQVISIRPYQQSSREENFETIRQQLLTIPGVEQVAKTTVPPADQFTDTSTTYFNFEGKALRLGSVKVSKDYFQTLNVDLLNGRLFNDSYSDQHTRSAIINETAARKMNISEITNQTISYMDCDSIPMQIVGIIQDFNVLGFEQEVQPAVYTIGNEACMYQSGGTLLVKIAGTDLRKPLAAIENVWKEIEPGFALRHSFVDENFQQLFAEHIRTQRIVSFFGITAIAIALMGLFALTAFLTGQRTKEISIRKVLGANLKDLNLLLSKDFIVLIGVAIIIASALGWWAAEIWLQSFAYRIDLQFGTFIISGLLVIGIAAIIISLHTIKAYRSNLAHNLKNE